MAGRVFWENDAAWIGYYSHRTGTTFDSGMHSLRFRVVGETDGELALKTTDRRDALDSFEMEGTLDRASGRFRGAKIYRGEETL